MAHEFKEDTLDDIRERDIFNLETFLKKKGRIKKTFNYSHFAQEFQGIMFDQILNKLGISMARACVDPFYKIDEIMKAKNIVIENRMYEEPEDEWRSGLYIYKDHEIAGFIGYPIYDPEKFTGYHVLCTEKI